MRYLNVKPSDMICARIFSRVILLCARLIRAAVCLLEIRSDKFNVKASAPSSALISSPDFKPALMQDQHLERLRRLRHAVSRRLKHMLSSTELRCLILITAVR